MIKTRERKRDLGSCGEPRRGRGGGVEAGRPSSLVPAGGVLRCCLGRPAGRGPAGGHTHVGGEVTPSCVRGPRPRRRAEAQRRPGEAAELGRPCRQQQGKGLRAAPCPRPLPASRWPGCARNKFVVWKDSRPVIRHPREPSPALVARLAASPFPRQRPGGRPGSARGGLPGPPLNFAPSLAPVPCFL